MNTKLLAVLIAGGVAAAPAAASAQISTSFSIAGGLSVPSGEFGGGSATVDAVKTGYNLAAGLNIGVPLLPVGVRLEAAFNDFEYKNLAPGTSGSQSIISGTVNGTFGLGLPYVIGGIGYYSTKAKASGGGTTLTSERDNAAGVNGGVGIRFPLGLISTFAEIRYHKMLGSDNASSSTKPAANVSYIPITFGINF